MVAAALLLSGCRGSLDTSILPSGSAAYAVVPSSDDNPVLEPYRLGALDRINISVFREPDLTQQNLQVDASGSILFPLIGEIRASGKTTTELAAEIGQRLGQRFLVNPYVTVTVASSVSQTVTVEGDVSQPGIFELSGPSSLLGALALAHSPTPTAKLDQIIVFRRVNGQRMGAVFNLSDIRSGRAQDPQILGGDTIVVGYSAVRGAWRDFLQAAPVFTLFTRF